MWTKRMIAILIGLGLVYLVGSKVYEAKQQAAAPAKKKSGGRVVNVDLVSARIGEVREELLLTGSLKPKEMVDVNAQATGRVEKIHFLVGDVVRAGELIAELEDSQLQQQVRRSEASIKVSQAGVTQRKAELANTRANLDRARQLFEEELLSPQEFQQQQTSLEVMNAQVALAEAQLTQVQAELNELKIRLAQAKIYAPMAGIVAARQVDPGALVNPNNPILRIVNLSTMVTQGNVPERSIGKLRVGNRTTVEVDAIPGKIFTGLVARIAPVLDAATRSALIEIDIPNPDAVLKAEMFARITLDLGSMREATLIPRDGLVYRGQQPGVYVVEDNADRPVFRAIETGMTREDNVEVLANLDAGTRIVGRGATMLRDGDRISTGRGNKKGAAPGKAGTSKSNTKKAGGAAATSGT